MLIRPSYQELVNTVWNKIQESTTVTSSIDDSVIGALVKITAAELDKLYSLLEDTAAQLDINTATGEGLEIHGRNVGLTRKPASRASSIGFARSIRFTNTSGGSITVPQGTRLWSDKNPQLAFYTSEELIVPAASVATVHATAAEPGDSYNIPANYINKHSFNSGSILVTNTLPIITGSFRESDDSFRERIIQAMRSRYVFNAGTVSALLRSLPEVQDVLVLERRRGVGTYDCIVVPYNLTIAPTVVAKAQDLLDYYSPPGYPGRAVSPTIRYMDFKVSVNFKPNTESEREEIRSQIKELLYSFVERIPLEDGTGSGTVYINEVTALVQGLTNKATSVRVQAYLDDVQVGNEDVISLNIGDKVYPRTISIQ